MISFLTKRYDEVKMKRPRSGGYAALMATIVISLMLLVMVAQEGFAGWHARFNVLGTEQKEQANALADGCANQALARLITDPTFTGATMNTLPSGSCYVLPITVDSSGNAIIRVQAKVGNNLFERSTVSNLAFSTNVSSIHIGANAEADQGTLVVQTLVQNSVETAKQPSDFTMHVTGVSTSLSSFAGSATGVVVHMLPGNYSVGEDSVDGFSAAISPSGCSGTIAKGEVKTCTITNNAIATTLTLVVNVKNQYNGIYQPIDFPLFVIDSLGATTSLPVMGLEYVVPPGIYTASTTIPDGYIASDWAGSALDKCGADGKVTLKAGDRKVCIIEIDDVPPPNPSCADTVMMLDRTGSMSSTERGWLKTAALALESLYELVHVNSPNLPVPSLGVGSFGGLDGSPALIPNGTPSGVFGTLTHDPLYTAIKSAISSMMNSGSCSGSGGKDTCTDISAALTAGATELGSSRHDSNNQKVMILISDGVPSLPSGSSVVGTGTTSPTANAVDAGGGFTSPASAYATGDVVDASTVVGTGAVKQQYYNFNLPTIASDATISGIEVDADAWSAAATGSASTSPAYPSSTSNASFDDWAVNTGSVTTSVGSNDATDSTYISTASATLTQTYNVPDVSSSVIPSGATVNSVTLFVVAKGTASGATLTPIVAKDTNNVQTGPAWNLTTSYATYSYVFPKRGDGTSWTQGEVTNWTNSFGVRVNAGSVVPRVTQMYVMVNYTSSGSTVNSQKAATVAMTANPTGTWTNAGNAFLSDNVYATDATNNHQQGYGTFGFSLPTGAVVSGVLVNAEAKVSGTGSPTNTSTLYPSGDGNYTSWSTGDYQTVDETSPKCDSNDYVNTSSSNARNSFQLDLSSIPNGSTINSVTITVGDRGDSSSGGTYKTFIRIGSTDTDGSSLFTATGSSGSTCTTHTQAFSSLSVSKSSSTNLEIGVVKINSSGSANNGVRVGSINAVVNYTPGITGSAAVAVTSTNGSTWTSSTRTLSLTTTEAVLTPSGNSSSDTWSRSWTASDFNNGNFGVRLTNTTTSGITVSLDQVLATVYYTNPSTATTTALYPSSTGDFNQWIPTGTSSATTAVNASDATDTNYIDMTASYLTHTFDVPDISSTVIPSGSSINSVTLYVVARGTASGATLMPVVDKDSTHAVAGPAWNLTTNYATYAYTFPTTGDNKSWTQSEVTNWTNSFGVRTTGGSPAPRVTQMYVVVNYGVTSACQLGVDLSWDGGTTWVTEKKATLTGSQAKYILGKSSDTWGRTWFPAEFTNTNFRARVHAIDPGSSCASTDSVHLDWLRLNVFYTGTVARAATLSAADAAKISGVNIFSIYYNSSLTPADESFAAELASGHVYYEGHESGSDFDPYAVNITNKTTSSITASAAVSPNQWTTPQNGYGTTKNYATSKATGNAQGYTGFNFNLPPASSPVGLEVDLHAKGPSSSSSCLVSVSVSADGGATFSTPITASPKSTSDKSLTFGGSSTTWGRIWASTDFDIGNFIVKIQDVRSGSCSTSGTASINQVKAKITYNSLAENDDKDNFFIAPAATDIPAIFDYIGNNVCPAARPVVTVAPTTATLLILTRMATGDTTPLSAFSTLLTSQGQAQTPLLAVAPPGISVTVNPGAFSITENAVNGYTEILSDGCSSAGTGGVLVAGETRVCLITNDVLPPPPSLTITQGQWQEIPSNTQ